MLQGFFTWLNLKLNLEIEVFAAVERSQELAEKNPGCKDLAEDVMVYCQESFAVVNPVFREHEKYRPPS